MEQKNNLRQLYILQYLYEQTDDDHPATTADIVAYLDSKGIASHRQTISSDITLLQDFGLDIIDTRSRQNQYFYGSRQFELVELKMMVDAIQAAKFITQKKSTALIQKIAKLTNVHRAAELDRKLYTTDRVKSTNENILYTTDVLYDAINRGQQVKFKYYEYTANKEKVFKHGGQVYEFSPYDLAWCNDCYYVFGFSKSHNKVIKFRVDRIAELSRCDAPAVAKPEDYDLSSFFKRTFSMYDNELHTVELLCENQLMKSVVDRFGDTVQTKPMDCGHFLVTAEVSVSPTFFSWVFTYNGRIRILSPKSVCEQYKEQLANSLKYL